MPSPRGKRLTLWVVERLFLFLAPCFASTQECKCCKGRTGSSGFGALGQVKDLNCYDLRLSHPLKIDVYMCVCVCSKMWAVLFPLLQLNYPIKSTDLFDSVLQSKEGAKKALTPGHLDRMGDGTKVRMWGRNDESRDLNEMCWNLISVAEISMYSKKRGIHILYTKWVQLQYMGWWEE